MSRSQPRSPAPSNAKYVTCPACRGESLYGPSNPFRPFCSERCKQIDLGAWASEEFRVPTEPPTQDRDLGDGLPHIPPGAWEK